MNQQIAAILCSLTFLSGTGVHASLQENRTSTQTDIRMDMQNLLQEYLKDNGTPGAAIGLIDHGKVQFFCSGNMSLDEKPITQETIFEIGSITKVFTTLLLMDMVVKGELQLDDPIELYLPGIKVPQFEGKKITLRHLAMHTSGLPRMPDNMTPKDLSNPYQDYTIDSLYQFLQSCSPTKAPGTSLEYSNLGMGLLGHILSLQSGKSYEELIQSLVAVELDMPNTMIVVENSRLPYFADGHHIQHSVSHWDLPPAFAGAGALRSTIQDMTHFLAANMGKMQSPLCGILQKCHEQQTPAEFSVGLGWVLTADTIWHSGGTGGFRSFLGFNPKIEKGIVILTNSTEDWPEELGRLFLVPNYQRPIVNKSLANDTGYLNKFVGSYEVIISDELPKQSLQISVFGKLLASALSGGEVGMLYPESHGVFGVKGFPDGRVYFNFDDAGDISNVEAKLVSTGAILWKAIPIQAQ